MLLVKSFQKCVLRILEHRTLDCQQNCSILSWLNFDIRNLNTRYQDLLTVSSLAFVLTRKDT